MRRCLLGVVLIAGLVACSDSSPTSTAPRGVGQARSAVAITPSPSLDANISSLIALWPQGLATALTSQWTTVKRLYAAGDFAGARLKLADLTSFILKKTPDMGNPGSGDTKTAAASRLILYMALYVNQGPGATPPSYVPGADNAVGVLTPGAPLTLITPNNRAGTQFDANSTLETRIIIIRQNPDAFYGICQGPLDTPSCQYPLFYFIESFPDGPLLKLGKVSICQPAVTSSRGPANEITHDRLRLAHTKPSTPAGYSPQGTISGNIEILAPLVTGLLPPCGSIQYPPPSSSASLLQRGVYLASSLASRIGRALTPSSAYAIDQGGGSFLSFSPFNAVDPLVTINTPYQVIISGDVNGNPFDQLGTSYIHNYVVTTNCDGSIGITGSTPPGSGYFTDETITGTLAAGTITYHSQYIGSYNPTYSYNGSFPVGGGALGGDYTGTVTKGTSYSSPCTPVIGD